MEKMSFSGRGTLNAGTYGEISFSGSGKINGDIVCETIIVEAGASLKGNLTSGSKSEVKQEAPSVKPEPKTDTPPSEPIKTDAVASKN